MSELHRDELCKQMTEEDVKPKVDIFGESDSGSDSDEEHDLSFYVNDRLKLMKKIFKIMTSKRIHRMAPECLKDMPVSEMKTLLLDELMGISNKRLTSVIFDKAKEVGSSSSESEHNRQKGVKNDGVISLDDITDDGSEVGIIDDNCMEIELSERERLEMEFECPEKGIKRKHKKKHLKHGKKKHKPHVKKEEKIDIKQENGVPTASSSHEVVAGSSQEEPVMSALNLLELQARARAIRSQLRCEMSQTTDDSGHCSQVIAEGGDSPNSVVVVSPPRDVVVVHESSHSEAESDGEKKKKTEAKKKKKSGLTSDIAEDQEKNPGIKTSGIASTNVEDDPDNDVLIMSATQEYEDFDKEFANVPLKIEAKE